MKIFTIKNAIFTMLVASTLAFTNSQNEESGYVTTNEIEDFGGRSMLMDGISKKSFVDVIRVDGNWALKVTKLKEKNIPSEKLELVKNSKLATL